MCGRNVPGATGSLADDKLARSPAARPVRNRWFHGNRAIQAAIEPLSIQQVHLQKNRIREFLAQRTKG